MTSSEAPGFYKKKPSERLEYVKDFAKLSSEEASAISDYGALGQETANRMIENVVGTLIMKIVNLNGNLKYGNIFFQKWNIIF